MAYAETMIREIDVLLTRHACDHDEFTLSCQQHEHFLNDALMTSPTITAKVQLPLMPLRDLVIFPHMVFPLFVGRPKSAKALEAAMNQGKRILLVAQKFSETNDVSTADLFETGCIAEIRQLLKLPDGTVKVVFEGVQRARIHQVAELETHFVADVSPIESDTAAEAKIDEMGRTAVLRFEQYVKMNRKIPPDILIPLKGITDAGRLADTIAAHLPVELEHKQAILEISSVLARYTYLLNQLDSLLNNRGQSVKPGRIVEAPFEPGSLRTVFDMIMTFEGADAWPAMNGQVACIKAAHDHFLEIKQRPAGQHGWPEIDKHARTNLYCASRVSDLMLLCFQEGEYEKWSSPEITRLQYVKFWTRLGFDAVEPGSFHPFWCEIVDVVESESDEVQVLEVVWPALTLGPLLFARAGVRVTAPRTRLTPGIADRSILSWSYARRYRKACDMSHGLSNNSQWDTEPRLDFDLGDRYVYNADTREPQDLQMLPADFKDKDALTRADRIDLLRHRCLTRRLASFDISTEVSYLNDFFVESKSQVPAP